MQAMLVHVPNLVWTDEGPRTDQFEIGLMAMGMFSIGDAADRHGIPIQLVNMHASLKANPSFDLIAHVLNEKVEVLGFSAHWAKQLDSALRFATLIGERCPNIKIVLGGFSASFFASQILEGYPAVNAVVRGDGEIPFREYARLALDGADDFSAVPNLLWRRDGVLTQNPRTYTARPQDLEELDFARLDLLRDAPHYMPTYWTTRPEIAQQKAFIISTGRGCSFNCSFCGGAAVAQKVINNRTRYMFRSTQAVMKTMETAIEHGFTNMYFDYDPEPNGPYYFELFERVRKRGLKGLTCCFGAWKLPNLEFIRDMRRTFERGVMQISPETWSEEARVRNKDARINYTNQELEQTIVDCANHGLYTQVYFGYVMPYDTKDAVYRTLGYVDYLNERYGRVCEARNLRFSTDPGSPAFQRPEKHNITLFAPDLRSYLKMMDEANRRGYMNNLQLFKVNGMSDLDNYLAGQMPNCFYHLQRIYPSAMRLLVGHLGYERLLNHIERELLEPRWHKSPDRIEQHIFEVDDDATYKMVQSLARQVPLPHLPQILASEHQRYLATLAPRAAPIRVGSVFGGDKGPQNQLTKT